jgi:two-component system, LytTR family, response regulator
LKVRTVLVEDEPLALKTLRDFAADFSEIEIIGEAGSGPEAVRLIDEGRPDLVFLDVQLPEFSGLEVMNELSWEPCVVFTTAWDHYAVPAFELQAIDYLLKPFGRERFHSAVRRVLKRLDSDRSLPPLRERLTAGSEQPLERLFVRQRERIIPLSTAQIVRLEAAGEYVEIHANGQIYLSSVSLSLFEARLDQARFRRIHRSHIVNLDQLASMESHDERRLKLTMSDGSVVVASRAGSQLLRSLIA